MLKSLLVFLGAGLGGLARYWVGLAFHRWAGSEFPVGTLLINVTGCLAMGYLMVRFAQSDPDRDHVRVAVLVGVLGGYTTFSAFGKETLELVQSGEAGRAVLYVLLSVVLSLLAVWGGWTIATRAAA